VHQTFLGDGPQKGNENWKPRTGGAATSAGQRGPSSQAGARRLEPSAGNARQTGPDPTTSLMAERVVRMSQVILISGLGPQLGPGQSKKGRDRYQSVEEGPGPLPVSRRRAGTLTPSSSRFGAGYSKNRARGAAMEQQGARCVC
jgi:hypothetical protein